ncbi:hypothetical protein PsYK624_156420 [Phanerochaete sordida]|uniref:Uncharacterized protein n=1 Tax=Phanerochaete sordida TaxID=48140 RepID=A0A9P3LL72_9APHY|nr:hypothetical protein PsYK624_156420 [Phanerochaete sordida]
MPPDNAKDDLLSSGFRFARPSLTYLPTKPPLDAVRKPLWVPSSRTRARARDPLKLEDIRARC